jgi:hypothetical protein
MKRPDTTDCAMSAKESLIAMEQYADKLEKQNDELLDGLRQFRARIYQQSFSNMELREMVDSLISIQTKEKDEVTDRS